MPAPIIDPDRRDPGEVAPTDSYQPADPVWVYRGGAWRAGIIEAVSSRAATVTYRHGDSRATSVDTLTAECMITRVDADPLLDRRARVTRTATWRELSWSR